MYNESGPIATAIRIVRSYIPRQIYETTFIDQEKKKVIRRGYGRKGHRTTSKTCN